MCAGGNTATRCNTLQDTSTHCNTLQHIATHVNTLQHTTSQQHECDVTHADKICMMQHAATHCSTLQHTPTQFNTLQHTPAQSNTLQHSLTHCNARTGVRRDQFQCDLRGGWSDFWRWWNFSEQFQISPPNIWGGDFAPYEQSNTLKITPTLSNTLQHSLTHCNARTGVRRDQFQCDLRGSFRWRDADSDWLPLWRSIHLI